MTLGEPREHHATIGSTNERARQARRRGAAHGTLVSVDAQTAGARRQGRTWVTPPGVAIAASLVLREFDDLLPLRAGLAVADIAGPDAVVKWPNDVWLDGRKVAGVLAESKSEPRWAVLGIGVNVAVDVTALPEDAATVAGTLGMAPEQVEPMLSELLVTLQARLEQDRSSLLQALRQRDAARPPCAGRTAKAWGGIDSSGALLVDSKGERSRSTPAKSRWARTFSPSAPSA